jgi:hypothetical protein
MRFCFGTTCSTLTLSLSRDDHDQQVKLPSNRLKVGEAVSLKQYSTYSSMKNIRSWSGIITQYQHFHVTIALYQDRIESMLSLPLVLQRTCQI